MIVRFNSADEYRIRIRVIRVAVRPKPRFRVRAKFSTRVKFRLMVWISNGIKPRM